MIVMGITSGLVAKSKQTSSGRSGELWHLYDAFVDRCVLTCQQCTMQPMPLHTCMHRSWQLAAGRGLCSAPCTNACTPAVIMS